MSASPIFRYFCGEAVHSKTLTAHPAKDFGELVTSLCTDPPVLSATYEYFHALPKLKQSEVKTELSYVSPCTFPASPWHGRKKEHARECYLIFIDVDNSDDAARLEKPGVLAEALKGRNYLVYKTTSHTPDRPRLRVMVEADAIPPHRYRDAVRTIASKLDLRELTSESEVVSQAMFVPCLFQGQHIDFHDPHIDSRFDGRAFTQADIEEGHTFDSFASDAAAGQVADTDSDGLEYLRMPVQGFTPDMVKEMLSKLDPDMKRKPWLIVGAALKHQYAADPEQGFALFEEWSQKGSKYVESGPGSPQALWDSLESNPTDRQPATLRTIIDTVKKAGGTPSQTAGSVKPFRFIHSSDTEPCLETFDFVENVLIDASFAIIFGPSNLGKTTFAIDLAAQVARGGLYRDMLAVEQGAVLYVTLEGAKLFANRVTALKLEGKLPDSAPFFWASIEFSIMSDEDPRRLIETIKEVEREAGTSFKFVVIDTLARAMAGHDENSTEEMGKVAKNAGCVQRETGACVGIVHHTGKDAARGSRGAYSLKCAIDTEIELSEGEDGKTVVSVSKQRDLPKIPPWAFSLKVVPLGVNNRGKPVTACVIDHHSEPVAAKNKADPFKKQKEPPTADSVFDLLPEVGTIKRSLFEAESRTTLNAAGRDLKAVLDRLIEDKRVTEKRVKVPSGQRENHVSRHPCSKGVSEASTHGGNTRV